MFISCNPRITLNHVSAGNRHLINNKENKKKKTRKNKHSK